MMSSGISTPNFELYHEILHQPCQFFDEEGLSIQTTVIEAARSANEVAEALQNRVIHHYRIMNWAMYDEDRQQFDNLVALLNGINSLVMRLRQDLDDSSMSESLMQMRDELPTIVSTLEENYFTTEESDRNKPPYWRKFPCLPDFLYELGYMNELSQRSNR